jgi:hypothetical protein
MSLCIPCSFVKTFSEHYFGTHCLTKTAVMLLWNNTIINTRSPQLMWHWTVSTFSARQCAKFGSQNPEHHVVSDHRRTVAKSLRTQLKTSAHTQHPPRYWRSYDSQLLPQFLVKILLQKLKRRRNSYPTQSVFTHENIAAFTKVEVKPSHYRPWQDLRVPAGWGSQILRQSAHEGSKVVSATHWPPLPPYSFLLEAESTPGP